MAASRLIQLINCTSRRLGIPPRPFHLAREHVPRHAIIDALARHLRHAFKHVALISLLVNVSRNAMRDAWALVHLRHALSCVTSKNVSRDALAHLSNALTSVTLLLKLCGRTRNKREESTLFYEGRRGTRYTRQVQETLRRLDWTIGYCGLDSSSKVR